MSQSESLQETIRGIYQVAGIGNVATATERRTTPLASGVIGIASPWPSEGKTVIAMALASTLANDFDGSAILADTDFATHSIAESYGLTEDSGMAALLAGTKSVSEVEYRVPPVSLRVIPAGMAHGDADRYARADDTADRFRDLKASARFVVVDLPAVMTSATAPVLAQYCDTVVLVARCGKTTEQDLKQTIAKLDGCQLNGVVVNRWDSWIPTWLERSMGLER